MSRKIINQDTSPYK